IYLCVPKITQNPQSRVIAAGSTATLEVQAEPAINGQPLTFDWYRSSDPSTSLGSGTTFTTAGRQGSLYTPDPMAGSDSFYARITYTCGSQEQWRGSGTALID